ncbi:MAG: hypothetical protein KDI36_19795, partial [Pseudomonadales bacterium]|nr:hypothetical protein [Pseudomonadales bacterium]
MKVLLRLLPYIKQHFWAFTLGMLGLLVARLFESMIPQFVKQGVDSLATNKTLLASGSISFDLATQALLYPTMAITACVIAQMLVTVVSRILIRRIGMYAAFDLRNRICQHLQLQGPKFYSQHSIGDLMARAINDISLVRQVIAGTTRMTAVLIFTATVSLIFMFSLSAKLTLAVIVPLPLIT